MCYIFIFIFLAEIFETKLKDVTILEAQSAVFTCQVGSADESIQWFHNDKEVTDGAKYITTANGNVRSLTIKTCRINDKGTVVAVVQGVENKASLIVKGMIAWLCKLKHTQLKQTHILLGYVN